ncbi:MAG: cytidine deaminase [Clostridiaceae bacterium]
MDNKTLIKEAIKARENAYAPYSKFKVGAAILTNDNKIYSGCNIENASFGATNCAERTAIFKAVSEGYKEIKKIAIVGDVNNYTFPCGICRQVLAEFAKQDMEIIIAKDENNYIVKSLKEILPGAFTPEDLAR